MPIVRHIRRDRHHRHESLPPRCFKIVSPSLPTVFVAHGVIWGNMCFRVAYLVESPCCRLNEMMLYNDAN